MMENFQYYAPTKVVFGKGTENKAGQLVKEQNCRKGLSRNRTSGRCLFITGAEV